MTIAFLALCAFNVMHADKYAVLAGKVQAELNNISTPAYRSAAIVPIVLRKVLPVGLLGLLAAVLLTGSVTIDDSALHSWGTIFIQDVIMPFRKSALDPKVHIKMLRWSITGVGVFAFFFSLLFRQSQAIYMYFAITGALFLGGAGSAIIGGLYWKRGSTAGAWTGMIVGAIIAVGGTMLGFFAYDTAHVRIDVLGATSVVVNDEPATLVKQHWEYEYRFMNRGDWQALKVVAQMPNGPAETRTVYYSFEETPREDPKKTGEIPSRLISVSPGDRLVQPMAQGEWNGIFVGMRAINGQYWFAIAMGASILSYILISLVVGQSCDMDKLLHRGKYVTLSDQVIDETKKKLKGWKTYFGITNEFTSGDKVIYTLTTGWRIFWITNFVVLVLLNIIRVGDSSWIARFQSDTFWAKYFEYKFYIELTAGMMATVWLCCGGTRDLIDLFKTLATAKRNHADDGRVVGHHNVEDEKILAPSLIEQ